MDSSFSKGKDLWILPDIKSSFFRKEMEWALNFQLAKSLLHSPAPLSPQAKSFIEELEASDFYHSVSTPSPWTLISVEGLLPAKWLIYSFEISGEKLSEELDKVWKGLNEPGVRIFPSETWTTQALSRLKSKCLTSQSTEIVNFGG